MIGRPSTRLLSMIRGIFCLQRHFLTSASNNAALNGKPVRIILASQHGQLDERQCYDSGSRPLPPFPADDKNISWQAGRKLTNFWPPLNAERSNRPPTRCDSMLRLVNSYSDRPVAELAPLFQRILKNVITDHFRRQKIRNIWTTLVSSLTPADSDNDRDILEVIGSDEVRWQDESAADQVDRSQTLTIIENEIKKLPKRQREAFMMRYWEEMDVAETAAAMGCSQGSVKTHCSRANRTLAKALAGRGITL